MLELLRPQSGGLYIDGTVGAGGHSAGILAASAPDGRLLAIDRDPEALAFARDRLAAAGDRVTYVTASYADMAAHAAGLGFAAVDGVLLDLGLSSRQLADEERGFSFQQDGPLDMRYDRRRGPTAADLVNGLSEAELAEMFWRNAEAPHSRRIGPAIVAARPLRRTGELATVVAGAAGRGRARGRHPATQVFQALRIAVNGELDAVAAGLDAAAAVLRPGGRLAVISFHSLEDRLVKRTMRAWTRDCVCPPRQPICTCDARATFRLIGRRAVKPSAAEVQANPRSRSARLRVAERLATAGAGNGLPAG